MKIFIDGRLHFHRSFIYERKTSRCFYTLSRIFGEIKIMIFIITRSFLSITLIPSARASRTVAMLSHEYFLCSSMMIFFSHKDKREKRRKLQLETPWALKCPTLDNGGDEKCWRRCWWRWDIGKCSCFDDGDTIKRPNAVASLTH